MKKKEIVVFGILFVIAAVFAVIYYFARPKADLSDRIRIMARGEVIGTYSLGKDQIIDIAGTNVCEIKDGTAKMTQASCPDHRCMEWFEIRQVGDFIICLPNEVIIECIPAEGAENLPAEDGVDAVAR